MYLLHVLKGNDCHQERQIHDLRSLLTSKGTVLIGRDPNTADISMDSKELPAMISRLHAEICCDANTLYIQDKASVNGTWYVAAWSDLSLSGELQICSKRLTLCDLWKDSMSSWVQLHDGLLPGTQVEWSENAATRVETAL
jgi:hypothetical protein